MKLDSGKGFQLVTMIALKKPKYTKRSDHCTNSITADTAKIVARILRRTERKIEGVYRVFHDFRA